MRKICIVVVALLLTSGCAKVRHAAVQADAAFASSVFALSDAQFQACQAKVLDKARCDALDPVIKESLLNVKAITAALQASPDGGAVPKNLPDLLKNLDAVRTVLAPLGEAPGPIGDLVTKAQRAFEQAVALLTQFTGGK